jgi:transposase InsO family protein
MELREQFIRDVIEMGMPKSVACRHHGISRPTGDLWLRRWEAEGTAGLADRSHAPHSIPHRTPPDVEAMALQLRRSHPELGPKKLQAILKLRLGEANVPAVSTLGDILSRSGLIPPAEVRRRAPPHTDPLRHARAPNQVWSIDFKGQFLLRNGQLCYPLTITDNATRMILGIEALPATHTALVRPAMEAVFVRYGLPDWIRSDNGAPFASGGVMGLSKLSVWWLSLGVGHERIQPGHPEQNGRHERMHLTLKQQTTRPAAHDMAGQQERFDSFRRTFNEMRPHEALGQTPPAQHYHTASRRFPDDVAPLDYSHCDLVHTVKPNGDIRIRKVPLFVGEALAGQRVGLTELDDDVWLVSFAGHELGVYEPGDTKITPLSRGKYSRLRAGCEAAAA